MSVSTENFIKTVYKLELEDRLDSKPGTIARTLGISNSAATDMARKLAGKDLVNYVKYQQLKLTPQGKKLALGVLRKHRLWESFLHKVFNLSLHEIHREAELLEHQTSDFLANRISLYLGNPEFDPHGDPIPDVNGSVFINSENVVLTKAAAGKKYTISRLMSSDKDFFDFCLSNNLEVDSTIEVVKQYHISGMTEIIANNSKILLNAEIAGIIYVLLNE